jgi:predicted nucleic acid-binding Zn ribbon protein
MTDYEHPDDGSAADDYGDADNYAEAQDDLALDALEAAKAIAAQLGGRGAAGTAGGPSFEGAPGTRRYRRRRRATGDPVYSAARADPRDPVPMDALVRQIVTDQGWQAPLAYARLMGQWATIVGPDVAARCHPVSLTDGVLRISADSTAWATQLRFIAPQLLARITGEMPAGMVKRLTIHGPTGPSWKRGPWSVNGRGVRDTYG